MHMRKSRTCIPPLVSAFAKTQKRKYPSIDPLSLMTSHA